EPGGWGPPRGRQSVGSEGEDPRDAEAAEAAARAPDSARVPAPEEPGRKTEASGRGHSAGAGRGGKRGEEAPPRGGDCGDPLDV
ncbi:hypothetical protein MOQ_003252, partial [Trypanosoma cruzi marinkellei]